MPSSSSSVFFRSRDTLVSSWIVGANDRSVLPKPLAACGQDKQSCQDSLHVQKPTLTDIDDRVWSRAHEAEAEG